MHLEGPWLSTTGKKKGKQKFASAEHAKKAREQEESWKELQKRWGIEAEEKKRKRGLSAEVWKPNDKPFSRYGTDVKHPSLPFTGGPCLKAPDKVYTGTMIKGIGTMHKSNAVPIFSNEEAIEISKMRR
jgi:hypothetical protein